MYSLVNDNKTKIMVDTFKGGGRMCLCSRKSEPFKCNFLFNELFKFRNMDIRTNSDHNFIRIGCTV